MSEQSAAPKQHLATLAVHAGQVVDPERMPGAGQADALVEPVWHDVRQAVREVLAGATVGAAAERARSNQTYVI